MYFQAKRAGSFLLSLVDEGGLAAGKAQSKRLSCSRSEPELKICNLSGADLSARMPNRKGTINYQILAQRVLEMVDHWQQPEVMETDPAGRVPAIAALIELCFGPDGAEAIARDLMIELDEFDLGDPDDPAIKPGPEEREEYLAGLLRKEFESDPV